MGLAGCFYVGAFQLIRNRESILPVSFYQTDLWMFHILLYSMIYNTTSIARLDDG
jgi:hypothetical protein